MKKQNSLFEVAKAISDKETVSFTIDDWNQFKMARGEKDVIIPSVNTSDNLEKILRSPGLTVDLRYYLQKYNDINDAIFWTLFGETPLALYIKNSK